MAKKNDSIHPTSYPAQSVRTPDLIARIDDSCDSTDVRSSTRSVASVAVPFEGAAVGCACVNVFESTQSEDRGGYVIQLSLQNDASALLPHAVQISGGLKFTWVVPKRQQRCSKRLLLLCVPA